VVHASLLLITSWEGCWNLPDGSGYAGIYKMMPLGALVVALFGMGMAFLMGRGKKAGVAVRAIAGFGGLACSLLALIVFPFTGMYLDNMFEHGMAASAVVYLASPVLYVVTLVRLRSDIGPAPFLPALAVSMVLIIGGHMILRDAVPGSREERLADEKRDATGLRIIAAVEHEDAAALATPEMWEYAARQPLTTGKPFTPSGNRLNALGVAIDEKRVGAVRVLLQHLPPNADTEVEQALWVGDQAILDVYSDGGVLQSQLAENEYQLLRTALRSEVPGGVLYLAAHGVGAARLLCFGSDPQNGATEQRDMLRHEKELRAHAHHDAFCELDGGAPLEERLAQAHAAIDGLSEKRQQSP
jgi:hypothetical protein